MFTKKILIGIGVIFTLVSILTYGYLSKIVPSSQKTDKISTQTDLENIYADNYRTKEDSRFIYIFWAGNSEGEVIPSGLILIDKTKTAFEYKIIESVWDASYDPTSNSIFIGKRVVIPPFDSEYTGNNYLETKIQETADHYNISYDELMGYWWGGSNMCGDCPTFTVLEKLDLNNMSTVETFIFGGEEVKVDEETLVISQYTVGKDSKRNNCYMFPSCPDMTYKVIELSIPTMEITNSYFSDGFCSRNEGCDDYNGMQDYKNGISNLVNSYLE